MTDDTYSATMSQRQIAYLSSKEHVGTCFHCGGRVMRQIVPLYYNDSATGTVRTPRQGCEDCETAQ